MHDSEIDQHGYQKSPSVTDQRQRQPRNRSQADAHSDIDDGMEEDYGCDSDAQIAPEIIRRKQCGAQDGKQQEHEHQLDEQRADESGLLRNDGKDEVGIGNRLRQVSHRVLRALHEALARESPASDRHFRL